MHYNQEIDIKMFLLIFQDEFSHLVQEWNTQRMNALSRAFNQMLYPLFEKELKLKLLEEAKNFVVKVSLSLFLEQTMRDQEWLTFTQTIRVEILCIDIKQIN